MIGQSLSTGGAARLVWAVTLSVAACLGAWIGLRSARDTGPAGAEADAPVEILEPRGMLAAAPRRFAWKPVTGAASYEVSIADDDTVWPLFVRRTEGTELTLEAHEAAALSPRRVFLWEATARAADGRTLARGQARFRIDPPDGAPRESSL